MQNRLAFYFFTFVLFNCLLLILLNVQGQDYIRPLKQTQFFLSGNFGELRATHLHAGLDFRTGGVEGLPVRCVKDGYVVRVRVSPGGYGQAVYVEHADGTTTVYGHLQRFCKKIGDVVRKLQYERESFSVDGDLRSYRLFFKQGDILAYSGNTGSSGGPHLHFEVRNTQNGHLINPLHYYKVQDRVAPKIKGVYLYSISALGVETFEKRGQIKLVKPGEYSGGNLTVPAGSVGVAVFAEDFMEGSQNRLGIYKMVMKVKGDTLFHMLIDTVVLEQSCFMHDLNDFQRYQKKETTYRCFGHYQNQIAGVRNRNKGYIKVEEGKRVPVEVRVSDINGNSSVLRFTVVGGKAETKTEYPGDFLLYNQSYRLYLSDCSLSLESNSLYHSVKKVFRVDRDTAANRNIYVLSEKAEPLIKKARLHISGRFSDKTRIGECSGTSWVSPLPTFRDADGIYANIGRLGKYTTVEDVDPPVITYLGVAAGRRLQFKIRDKLSGIATFRGEVNGKWCLFTYDAKNALFFCELNEPVFIKGKVNKIRVVVTDGVGNSRKLEISHKL